jgi:hypothetical protein
MSYGRPLDKVVIPATSQPPKILSADPSAKRDRSCPVQQTKKVPHGAEFKDILQMCQLKYLLDLLRDIHHNS